MSEIARAMQQSAQDTVRWGDRVSLQFGANPSSAALTAALQKALAQGRQLANVHWRWPCTWQVALVLVPQFTSGDLSVTFDVAFGSGNNILFQRTVLIPNGTVAPVIDTSLVLPAQDIQIAPSKLFTSDSHAVVGPGTLEIGAFIAPVTEVHALTFMLECLCKIAPTEERAPGERWMPPGFFPEPMGYRR